MNIFPVGNFFPIQTNSSKGKKIPAIQFVLVLCTNDFCTMYTTKGTEKAPCTFVYNVDVMCDLLLGVVDCCARVFISFSPFITEQVYLLWTQQPVISILVNVIHATILHNYYLEWFLHVCMLCMCVCFSLIALKINVFCALLRHDFMGTFTYFRCVLCTRNQNNKNTLARHFDI